VSACDDRLKIKIKFNVENHAFGLCIVLSWDRVPEILTFCVDFINNFKETAAAEQRGSLRRSWKYKVSVDEVDK
jgi:hypothetical protein